jgi:hypothetical protein
MPGADGVEHVQPQQRTLGVVGVNSRNGTRDPFQYGHFLLSFPRKRESRLINVRLLESRARV